MKLVTCILLRKERKNVLSITICGLWRSIISMRFLFYDHSIGHCSLPDQPTLKLCCRGLGWRAILMKLNLKGKAHVKWVILFLI